MNDILYESHALERSPGGHLNIKILSYQDTNYKSLLSNHAPIKGWKQGFKHVTVCNRREYLKFGT